MNKANDKNINRRPQLCSKSNGIRVCIFIYWIGVGWFAVDIYRFVAVFFSCDHQAECIHLNICQCVRVCVYLIQIANFIELTTLPFGLFKYGCVTRPRPINDILLFPSRSHSSSEKESLHFCGNCLRFSFNSNTWRFKNIAYAVWSLLFKWIPVERQKTECHFGIRFFVQSPQNPQSVCERCAKVTFILLPLGARF